MLHRYGEILFRVCATNLRGSQTADSFDYAQDDRVLAIRAHRAGSLTSQKLRGSRHRSRISHWL